ncbi:hypothetical protein [Actinoplanes sp. NPDC026619]|uniref:hypothetical protein n=1 Tax=Actinoplanes sp. NPDC026619 TaxID=3155798 RepID=UPI00341056CD
MDDDLAELLTAAVHFSNQHGIALVPAVPVWEGVPEVRLSLDMEWVEFLELGRQMGVRALYLDPEKFDPEEEQVTDPVLLAYEGRVCRLEAVFVAGGVVHAWDSYAEWYEERERSEKSLNENSLPTEEGLPSFFGGRATPRLSDEERRAKVEELVAELLVMPEYRSARRTQRYRVAEAHIPSDLDNRTRWDAIYGAADKADEVARERYARLSKQYEDLARRLLQDPAYRAAASAGARKQAAERFLTDWAGGFVPNSMARDELYAQAQRLAKTGRGSTLFASTN